MANEEARRWAEVWRSVPAQKRQAVLLYLRRDRKAVQMLIEETQYIYPELREQYEMADAAYDAAIGLLEALVKS